MMKSELYSWPVTMLILVLAFGSLVAAGLPLMLTIIGLVAAAGSLYLGTKLGDISIWAMNFALMFALALGIDYALFLVVRFRAAHFGAAETPAEATTSMNGSFIVKPLSPGSPTVDAAPSSGRQMVILVAGHCALVTVCRFRTATLAAFACRRTTGVIRQLTPLQRRLARPCRGRESPCRRRM